MKIYHILNGDCLAKNFPEKENENLIVWRECLIDGPVQNDLFFENRKSFIEENYGPDADYEGKVLFEWNHIQKIESGSKVFLWFEEDAFCQVNLWFLMVELASKNIQVFRVLPDFENGIFEGFRNGYSPEFAKVEANISDFKTADNLWKWFQNKNSSAIPEVTKTNFFPHLSENIKAVQDIKSGKVLEILQNLYQEFNQDFNIFLAAFFREFPQYGLGDLQVKRMLNIRK